jgi:hypothetical protein
VEGEDQADQLIAQLAGMAVALFSGRGGNAMPIILWLLGVPAILIVLYLAFAG